MPAYYNEIDPHAAQWLRNLIARGLIAPGDVDERSIVDVRADDLRGYTQCHFFAGVGVWSYALRGAGWADDRPVWTGSCPCQPFSAAGKGDEFADERHLWPAWFRLIRECRPDVVFGEQVSSKDALAWFDHVSTDLEGEGYAVGALDSCAAGVGAPHIRQRLYFVADAMRDAAREHARELHRDEGQHDLGAAYGDNGPRHSGATGAMADDAVAGWGTRSERDAGAHGRPSSEPRRLRDARAVAYTGLSEGTRQREHGGSGLREQETTRSGEGGELGDAGGSGSQGWADKDLCGTRGLDEGRITGCASDAPSATNGFWRNAIWIPCRDGKARPIEPGTFPLAHGAAARVGRLRAYGNAIVAPQAQAFIESYCER